MKRRIPIGTLHVAHWVPFEHNHMGFFTVYDGDMEKYFQDFADKTSGTGTGIVGKYVEYEDSYKSLKEALVHGALAHNLKLNLNWIEAEGLETGDRTYEEQLADYNRTAGTGSLANAASKEC